MNARNIVRLLVAVIIVMVVLQAVAPNLMRTLFSPFDNFTFPSAPSASSSGGKGVPTYRYRGNPLTLFGSDVEKIDVGFKNDSPFVWIAATDSRNSRGGKSPFTYYVAGRIDIINPIEKTLVASLDSKEMGIEYREVSNFERQGKYFFIPQENALQLRAADGELAESNETLSKKFPELAAGVGKVEKKSGIENYFRVTTKDGFQYLYFPDKQVLLTEEAFEKKRRAPTDTTDKDYEFRYIWALSEAKGSARQQLYLVKKYDFSLAPSGFGPVGLEMLLERMEREAKFGNVRGARNARRRDEELALTVPSVFLDAEILASNSEHCVVLHSQTIEQNADKILTCVNREGKTLWQIVAPPFKTFEKVEKYGISSTMRGALHANTLVIVNNHRENRAACALDVQTGKMLWEFSAF